MPLQFLLGITMGFAAAVQPGPTQLFLVTRTLIDGWRRALPLATVFLVSDLPIVALVLLVLRAVPDGAAIALRLAGGAVRLYRAWRAARARGEGGDSPAAAASPAETYGKAVAINLLNPNPYLQWSLVMGPLLLQAWKVKPVAGVAVLAAFYGTLVLTTAALILAFGLVGRLGAGTRRALVGVSAAALAGFGLYQIAAALGQLRG
jgi:threonine/homoserine/homoserine lactone efflux protein